MKARATNSQALPVDIAGAHQMIIQAYTKADVAETSL